MKKKEEMALKARFEQEKALAHRRGISDFKAGVPLEANPFIDDTLDGGPAHRPRAWHRAWEAERELQRR